MSIIFKKQVYFPKCGRSYKRCCAFVHIVFDVETEINSQKNLTHIVFDVEKMCVPCNPVHAQKQSLNALSSVEEESIELRGEPTHFDVFMTFMHELKNPSSKLKKGISMGAGKEFRGHP